MESGTLELSFDIILTVVDRTIICHYGIAGQRRAVIESLRQIQTRTNSLRLKEQRLYINTRLRLSRHWTVLSLESLLIERSNPDDLVHGISLYDRNTYNSQTFTRELLETPNSVTIQSDREYVRYLHRRLFWNDKTFLPISGKRLLIDFDQCVALEDWDRINV